VHRRTYTRHIKRKQYLSHSLRSIIYNYECGKFFSIWPFAKIDTFQKSIHIMVLLHPTNKLNFIHFVQCKHKKWINANLYWCTADASTWRSGLQLPEAYLTWVAAITVYEADVVDGGATEADVPSPLSTLANNR